MAVARRPGLVVCLDEDGHFRAEIWPVLRPEAFGDWEYAVVAGCSGREKSEEAAKKKVDELLNPRKVSA